MPKRLATAKREKPGPKPDCPICQGKGWFYAGHVKSGWPAECPRCVRLKFPSKPA